MASHDAAAINYPSGIPLRLSTRSPRSSPESSPRTPTSPFLQNLSNRLRKGSNASNISNVSEGPLQASNAADTADSADTAQSAKRFVLSVVRNDWEWPPPQPPPASEGENTTDPEIREDLRLSLREPVGWRTRHEGASDLDLDLSPVTSTGKRKNKRNSDPYRFESPDAITNAIQEQRYKRRKANVEEAKWNKGLLTWTRRRDAWTAAETQRPKTRSSSDMERHHRSFSPSHAQRKDLVAHERIKSKATGSAMINGTDGETPRRILTGNDVTDANNPTEDDALNGPYLPIYPPLFPTSHTLRSRIKPAAYPTIYSKVVVQSLTPNVPIPLSHMVGALVDGWKEEGNWPPQTIAEQQQYALLKRAKGTKRGETAFQKWRREREMEKNAQVDLLGDDFTEELVGDGSEKKSFRQSISGAVKKAFGMNHEEVEEEDGGLARLGLSFGDEDGMMRESRQVAEDNVTLNEGLLDGEKG